MHLMAALIHIEDTKNKETEVSGKRNPISGTIGLRAINCKCPKDAVKKQGRAIQDQLCKL